MSSINPLVERFVQTISDRNPNEVEFLQAVKEVADTVIPFIESHPKYFGKQLLERMTEAERIVIFRVTWLDDLGNIQVNRGYRIQMNSAIGPYKGGLRFHPTVNLSVLKFLAFEAATSRLPPKAGNLERLNIPVKRANSSCWLNGLVR